jgi:hypothetical protein
VNAFLLASLKKLFILLIAISNLDLLAICAFQFPCIEESIYTFFKGKELK